MKYEIIGGKKLSGMIHVAGNKNSVFPCVAAALLTNQIVELRNVPKIEDTKILIEILIQLGVEVSFIGSVLTIKAESIKNNLSKQLMTKLRGSIVLIGAILSREGKAQFHFPGGDVIGKRSIEVHLEGFKALGYDFKKNDLEFIVERCIKKGHPNEIKIFLPEASVTATENLVLASVIGLGTVELENCAQEPHIVDLCRMLIKMGAKIEGVGTHSLFVTRVKSLNGVNFTLGADYLEIGTYAIAAAITKGKVAIAGLDSTPLEPILVPLKKFGVDLEINQDKLLVSVDKLISIQKLVTNIWPGFPTDMMSAMIVLATQADGVTLMHDWMYESRMFFADKLMSMGANITIADPHRVLVNGVATLKGREMESPDIRAGMALVLAALVAEGTSIINKAELIERGYEDVVGKLTLLGAEIKKI